MKNCKRWIVLFLALIMCLSLCGCDELDDMRAAHAVRQEDGSILWNGNVYRQIENVPESFQFYSDMIVVTESDVPVLLSEMFGESLRVDSEGVLMYAWYWDGGEAYFCREDKCDEMVNYFQQDIELDTYYYNYWPEVDGEIEEAYYYLSDAEKIVIETVLNYAEFVEVDDDFYSSFEEDEFSVVLGRCDGKHLFAEHYVVEIISMRDGYYLFADDMLAAVPAEYNDTLDKIVADYYEWEVLPYLTK